MRKWYALLFILIIVLVSCQAPVQIEDSGQENAQITLKSIEDGAFVQPGETLPVSLQYDTSSVDPSRLEVTLEDAQGQKLGGQDYQLSGFVPGTALPEIELPELEVGEYVLVYTVYAADDSVLSVKRVPFFYTVGTYKISSISSFPPSIQPGATALLLADISVPDNSNPYFRWKLNDSVLKEGYLSDGGDRFQWIASQVEGVYTIRAELFPVKPSSGADTLSAAGVNTEIYVTKNPKLGMDDLQPESQYYSLFHFRGDFQDRGNRADPAQAVQMGNPELGVEGGLFGYRLDGHSGFRIPELLLPVKNGSVQPFSVVMLAAFDGVQQGKDLFTTESADGAFRFFLGTDDSGRLCAKIRAGGTDFSSIPQIEPLSAGEGYKIILSVIPGKDSLRLMWYVNDELVATENSSQVLKVPDIQGNSKIAGENGFSGVIDEFGIFFQDEEAHASVLQDIYKKAMQSEYGNDLRFAEGFDGTEIPSDIVHSDNVRLEEGFLILQPGAEIQLPSQLIHGEKLIFTVEFESPVTEKGLVISFSPETESVPPFSFDCTGTLSQDGIDVLTSRQESDQRRSEFALMQENSDLEFILKNKSFTLSAGNIDAATFGISIKNGTKKSIGLDTLRIISSPLQVAQKEQDQNTVAIQSEAKDPKESDIL